MYVLDLYGCKLISNFQFEHIIINCVYVSELCSCQSLQILLIIDAAYLVVSILIYDFFY